MCSSCMMYPTGCVLWRRGIELPDPGGPLQFVKERFGHIERPATVRHALGTARCGPARRVVWGLGEKNPRLPASALADVKPPHKSGRLGSRLACD
ncbi:MAG: hypothetical protein RBS57_03530 [Desulforhabdus sp.]|nr:hypothetical protein [Desulforhabdus sp.]